MNEVFRVAEIRAAETKRIDTRNGYLRLNHPFRKTSAGQNVLSYWNRIPEILKKTKILNTS